jgi:hypothetical protein
MCKSCADGGERCAADNSTTRRLREKVASAAANHEAIAPSSFKTELPGRKFGSREEIVKQVAALKKALHEKPVSNRAEQDKKDALLEMQVTELGKALAEEAETQSGLDLPALKEKFRTPSVEVQNFEAEIEKAKRRVRDAKAKLAEITALVSAGDKSLEEKAAELQEKVEKLAGEENQAVKNFNTAGEADEEAKDKEYHAVMQILTDSYKKVIADIRPCGGKLKISTDSSPELVENIKNTIGKDYPSSWIEDSNAMNDHMVALSSSDKGRYHYTGQKLYSNLSVEDYPYERPEYQPIRVGVIAVADVDKVQEMFGPDAKIAAGNAFDVNGVSTVLVESPTVQIFNPKIDRMGPGGRPLGAGWRMSFYQAPDKGIRSSTEKAWVKNVPTTKTDVLRPEILLPDNLDTLQSKGTTYHEFAHRCEEVVGLEDKAKAGKEPSVITRQEEAFLRRRTTDPETGVREPLRGLIAAQARPDATPLNSEMGRPDGFNMAYVGKEYIGSYSREVLSTGIEALFGGTMSALNGLIASEKKDDDHKGFTLGILACV